MKTRFEKLQELNDSIRKNLSNLEITMAETSIQMSQYKKEIEGMGLTTLPETKKKVHWSYIVAILCMVILIALLFK